MNEKFTSIYLQDHMAGAMAGVELARRAAESNGDNRYGSELGDVCAEIEQDRAALAELMDQLDVRPNPLKQGVAWIGERLGRLKPNGSVSGYSPLSRLVEIESLIVGVSGKLELWRSLRAAGDSNGRFEGIDLKRLIKRAESQRERLERLHDLAAADALSG
jgi:hypothetical protein